MKLSIYIPKSGLPISPGEILLEEFLIPMGMSQTKLAELTGLGTRAINEICKGKRAITPRTAILFSDVFNTSVEIWLNLQRSVDVWLALKEMGRLEEAMRSIPSRVVNPRKTKKSLNWKTKKTSHVRKKNAKSSKAVKPTIKKSSKETQPTKTRKYA